MGFSFGTDSRGRISVYELDGSKDIDIPYSSKAEADARLSKFTNPVTGQISFRVNGPPMFVYEVILNAAAPKYIDVPYDPYPAVRWGVQNDYVTEWHNFDLKQSLGAERYNELYDGFKMLPRNVFEEVACDVLSVTTENKNFRNKSGKEILALVSFKNFILSELQVFLVASNLIDMFNRANLEIISSTHKTPSQWESEKYRSYATKDFDKEKARIDKIIGSNPVGAGYYKDVLKRTEYEDRIKKLPRAKDPVINLQRDVSLAALVEMKEWEKLELVCSMYEKLPQDMKNAIAEI